MAVSCTLWLYDLVTSGLLYFVKVAKNVELWSHFSCGKLQFDIYIFMIVFSLTTSSLAFAMNPTDHINVVFRIELNFNGIEIYFISLYIYTNLCPLGINN